jgi:hypothetical protein
MGTRPDIIANWNPPNVGQGIRDIQTQRRAAMQQEQALKMQQRQQELLDQQQQIAEHERKVQEVGRTASAVQTPDDYARATPIMRELGLGPEDWPDQFNPNAVRFNVQKSLSAAQQLEHAKLEHQKAVLAFEKSKPADTSINKEELALRAAQGDRDAALAVALNNPPPPAPPTKYTPAEIEGPGGKPVMANFNPATGQYTDQAGAPIQNPRPYQKPAASSNDLPAGVDEYKFAQSQGYKGTYQDWKKESGARPNQNFSQTSRLRSDLFREIKTFPDVVDQINRIEAGASDPTAAGDIAIIFNFMKMLDPSSVVRESEFATAANAGSLQQKAIAAYNKAMNGERLSVKQRRDFVDTARRLYISVAPRYEKVIQGYKDSAIRNGLDPEDVVMGVGSTKLSSPVTVKGRRGETYTFPDQKSADAFKKETGL